MKLIFENKNREEQDLRHLVVEVDPCETLTIKTLPPPSTIEGTYIPTTLSTLLSFLYPSSDPPIALSRIHCTSLISSSHFYKVLSSIALHTVRQSCALCAVMPLP